MAGLMGGLHWIIGRRMKLAARADDSTHSTQGDKDDHA